MLRSRRRERWGFLRLIRKRSFLPWRTTSHTRKLRPSTAKRLVSELGVICITELSDLASLFLSSFYDEFVELFTAQIYSYAMHFSFFSWSNQVPSSVDTHIHDGVILLDGLDNTTTDNSEPHTRSVVVEDGLLELVNVGGEVKGLNPGLIVLLVVGGIVLAFIVGNYALYTYAQKALPPKKKKPVSKKKMKRERLKQGISAPGE
ncbi:hypothetical protein ACLOJK_039295 [Asimina triloba]